VGVYLHAVLEEEVFMEALPGITDMVLLLLKVLYGLKQAGHVWYKTMARAFMEMGFTVLELDQSVFIRTTSDGKLIVPVSTDDMLIAGSTLKAIEVFKGELKVRFKVTDLGELKWLLGFEVKRDQVARTITINQKAYIEVMTEWFGLTDAKRVWTPMEAGFVFEESKPEDVIEVPYQEVCRHVLWPAIISRPDIQFAVGILARAMCTPSKMHWDAIKQVMHYLHTTRDLWLVMGGGDEMELYGVADADWAGQEDWHLTSGYVMHVGGGVVSWSSKWQPTIALSTAEAEYIAATEVCKEILWFQTFLKELGFGPKGATDIKCDNQSAITLCKDPKYHACTKHLDIKYHFICKSIATGSVVPSYVPTAENEADLMTKVLLWVKFEKCVAKLGLRAFTWGGVLELVHLLPIFLFLVIFQSPL
jgi:hypothetical protein